MRCRACWMRMCKVGWKARHTPCSFHQSWKDRWFGGSHICSRAQAQWTARWFWPLFSEDGKYKKHRNSVVIAYHPNVNTWWRHQMETFSAWLAICAGNSPVPGEFPVQRPVMRSLTFSLICVWIKGWVNNREAGDLRSYRTHYDVIVMDLWENLDAIRSHIWRIHLWDMYYFEAKPGLYFSRRLSAAVAYMLVATESDYGCHHQ